MSNNKRQQAAEVAEQVAQFLAQGGHIKQLQVRPPEKPTKAFYKPVRCSDGAVLHG
jgi:hypothetical protein